MKNWQYFLGCLALSASIWLIHNLSHMQTDIITVQVNAQSNIPGRAAKSSDVVSITASCKASGFRLLYLSRKNTPVTVRFDSDDFVHEEGDFYSISSSQLYRYVGDIFGPETSVESFLSDKVLFRFIRELNKKVPVVASSSLSFHPQYMQNGEFSVQPDSVLIYGPADLLGRTDAVKTLSIVRSDIRSNLHGEVALDAPAGLRLSDEKVSWSLEVSRFVEIRAELPVHVRNVPSGSVLSIYPNRVSVLFRCVFPLIADPSKSADCYVDYKDFSNSLTGKCVIHCDNLPQGLISYDMEPMVAECVEKL